MKCELGRGVTNLCQRADTKRHKMAEGVALTFRRLAIVAG